MTTTSTSTTDIGSLLAQAGQSIISGATNSTLDVSSLVSALVTAKTAGQTQTLTTKQTRDNTELSAVGKLKSALSALQTAIAGLANGSTLHLSVVESFFLASLSRDDRVSEIRAYDDAGAKVATVRPVQRR